MVFFSIPHYTTRLHHSHMFSLHISLICIQSSTSLTLPCLSVLDALDSEPWTVLSRKIITFSFSQLHVLICICHGKWVYMDHCVLGHLKIFHWSIRHAEELRTPHFAVWCCLSSSVNHFLKPCHSVWSPRCPISQVHVGRLRGTAEK